MLADLRKAFAEQRFGDVVAIAGRIPAQLAAQPDALVLAINAAVISQSLAEADQWLSQLRGSHRDDAGLRRIHAGVLNRIGVRLGDDGLRDDARRMLERALQLDPDNPAAQFNLALEWRRVGRDDEAVPLLISLHDANPADEAVSLNLAECHAFAGHDEAVADLIEGQRVRGFSEPKRWRRLALAHAVDGSWIELLGGDVDVRRAADIAIGIVIEQVEQGRRDAAIATAHAAIQAYAGAAPIWRCMLAAKLHPGSVMASTDAIEQERQRWDAAFAEIRADGLGAVAPALSQLSWSNFTLGYHGRDELTSQSAYGDWLCAAAARMRPDLRMRLPRPSRSRPRVVLASSQWRHCTVGHYFRSWIDGLAFSDELDVIVLAIGPGFDDLTDSLHNPRLQLLRVEGEPDADRIAEALLALDADLILYPELGMDVRLLPVAALRLAPIQVMAWGHPVTSGLATIDAYLSCAEMEPADAQSHYRERLHLLQGIGTQYPTPARPDGATRAELDLHPGPLVVVPQSAVKIHPDNDAVYRDLLAACPDAQLLFFDNESPLVTRHLRERFAQTLPAAAMRRIAFHPLCARGHFLRVLGSCDLMLDTLHWSGGNTALDALLMGTPILTAPGRFMRGRQSAAMLRLLGVDSKLVTTPEQLAARAACLLAGDELPSLRAHIRHDYYRVIGDAGPLAELRQTIDELLGIPPKVLS